MIELPAETLASSITFAVIERLMLITGVQRVELDPEGDPDLFPSLAAFEGGWIVLSQDPGVTRWQMSLTIEGYVERGGGAAAVMERNGLHAAAVIALMADETLGNLVEFIEPTDLRKVTAMLASKRRLSFSQDFVLQFTTLRSNPALPG